MYQVEEYCPVEREREKERSRASDALELSEGRISREDLNARNSAFSGMDIARARIVIWKEFS